MKPKESIDKLIKTNYDKYLQFAKNMSNGNPEYQDILQECFLYIYEMTPEKQEEILPYFEFYLIQMVKFSLRSKSSKYQQKYNKIEIDRNVNVFSEDLILDNTEEIDIDAINMKIMKILNEECNWYEREIFLMKNSKNYTFEQLSKETTIPLSSLFKTYTKVKKIIKKNLYL